MVDDRSEAPVALFDMDGTLADFDGEMVRGMSLLASPNDPPWEPEREADEAPHIRQRRRLVKSVPGFWLGLPELADGFWILRDAYNVGFRIMILSKGPSNNSMAWMEKIDWCRQHLLTPPFFADDMEKLRPPIQHEITLTEDKGLVYGRVLVDDWPPYILKWLEWRPRGWVIMPHRRWNADFNHPQVLRFTGDEESREKCHDILVKSFARKGKEQVYLKGE
jgi:hypothetical protein